MQDMLSFSSMMDHQYQDGKAGVDPWTVRAGPGVCRPCGPPFRGISSLYLTCFRLDLDCFLHIPMSTETMRNSLITCGGLLSFGRSIIG